MSGKPLQPSDLVSNHKLKWEINQWQIHYGEAYDEETRLEMETKLSKASMISQGYHATDIIRALAWKERADSEEKTEDFKRASTEDILSCLGDVVGTVEDWPGVLEEIGVL